MLAEEPTTICVNVHYLERYYDCSIDDAPVLTNEGDAEFEFYDGFGHKPTKQDIIHELELYGYLVAKTGSRYERESIELNY